MTTSRTTTTSQSSGRQKANTVANSQRVARGLCRNGVLAALAAVVFLASGSLLFGQHSNTGTASLGLQVNPADQLTITGGTTVNLKIRLGTGPAYLWGDSLSDCSSAPAIGNPTTISTSGIYTPALTAVPFNTASNDYVCVYDPGTISLNTSVAWPHTGLKLVFNQSSIPNTAAGSSITPAVTVQVQDSNGILVASSTASVTIGITSGTGTSGATLSGTLTQSAVNGVATFNNLSINKDGTAYSLTATSSGISNGTSSTFNITSGTATKLVYTTAPSTGTAGTAFSVTVQSQDASGNPASPTSNTTITLSKATGGGTLSGTLTGTILTSGNSVTISTPIYSKADTMTLTATATAGETSLTPVTSSNIVFSASTATQLVFTSTPVTVTAGVASGTITVQRQDQYGNPNTTDATRSVTLSSTSAGTVTFNPASPLSIPNGSSSANFTYTDTKAGTPTITAASTSPSTITSATQQETVNPGTATKLAFTTQPGGGTGGTAWTTQPVVTVEDAYGNAVTSSSASIKLAQSSGTFACTINPLAASSGVATFAGCGINQAGSGYTLTATSSGLSTATSTSFTITVGTATQLAFTTEPVGGIYANPFPTQPVVTVQDAGGNTVSSTASITLTPTPSTTMTGCTNPLAATAGVATFSGCKIAATGSYTLTATSSPLTSATSTSFDVTSGGAGLSTPTVGAQTPNPVPRGGSATYSVSVSVNPVSACTATLSIANLTGGASGSFSPSQLVFTNASPLTSTLTVTTLSTTPVGTQFGINVSANGSNGCSGTYTYTTTLVVSAAVNPASATNSTVSASPTSVAADGSTTSTITVTLKDASNNLLSGKTVTLSAGSGGSTISAASGPSNSSGVVTFTVKDSKAEAVTYTAKDTTDSVTITSSTPTVTFTASKLAFITAPISTTAGTCSSQIMVQTLDGSNNPTDPLSTATVALSSSSTGTYGFYSNSTCTSPISGNTVSIGTTANSATFWYQDTKAGSPVITAAATGGVTSSPTQTETVNLGAVSASVSTVSASPTSVVADGATTSTITVTLTDAGSNAISGKTVTLAAGSGGSTITTVNGTTNSSGQATFTVKDSTAQAVTYTATDTTDSNLVINQTATVTFTASKLAITQVNGGTNPTAGTAFSVVVQAQDANGNAANVVANTGVTLSLNTGTGTLGGTLTGTVSAGTSSVTISGVTYTKAQSGVILTATRTSGDSLTAGNSAAFTVNPGAVSASVSTVSASPTSVVADGSTTSTITVTLLDANSNPVSGKTVTLTAGSGNSTISAASGPSSAAGVVTFTVKNLTAQSVTYTAKDATDTVTITSSTPTVTFTASKLAFTTSSFSVTAGVCTSSFATVQTQDGNGTATNPPSSVTVTLSSSSTGTKAFYSNSGCGTTTTTLTIGTGANSANFWYKDTQAGSPVITATPNGGLTGTTQTETVNVGAVSASASTVAASPTSVPADGATTSTITVTLMDANSNPVSGKTVTLTAGSGNSTISAASGPSSATGIVTFTVKDSTAQSVTYTAKDTTDTVTITSSTPTVAFTASKLVITGSGTQTAGGSQTITITAQDANGNTATSYTGSHSLTISGAGSSPNPVTSPTVNGTSFGAATSITFTSGVSTGTRTMVLYDAQTATISATDGTISSSGSGNLTVVVSAAAANKLAWGVQPPATGYTRGNVISPAMTVLIEDQYGNLINSTASVTLTFNKNGGNGTMSGTNPVSAIAGTATFSNITINANQANSGTFTATSTGLTSSTSTTFDY